MILFKGQPAAFNYTYGPALIYRGPKSIDLIYKRGEPVVVVADMIPMDELRRIELTRVRGFVFERGSAIDDDFYNFLYTEKRAAVLGVEGAMKYICDGDMLAVDGVAGLVCLEPNQQVLSAFQDERKQGPPDEKGETMKRVARAMLEGLKKEREEKIAKGEKIQKSGEVMTLAEAKEASKTQPGIIYQLLAGLPLPNSPTAEHHHHPHEHGAGEDHDHGHAHGHDDAGGHDHGGDAGGDEAGDDGKPKKMTAAERREAMRTDRSKPKGGEG